MNKNEQGSSILSSLIGIAIISGIAVGGVNLLHRYQTNQSHESRAAQISNSLKAAESFARKNQFAIVNDQPVAGFANPKAPTLQELAASGNLSQAYTDRGVGGQIKVSINIEPTGCSGAKCQLLVRTYLSTSVMDKAGQPDMAAASAIAGAIAGGSGWTNAPSDNAHIIHNQVLMPNPLGNTPAVVVAQLWIGSNQASPTIPPMSYETNTIADCQYGGSTTYQRTVTSDKWGAVSYGTWVYLYDSCISPTPPTPPVSPVIDTATQTPGPTPFIPAKPDTPPDIPTPLTCANGASNYPTCSTVIIGGDTGTCSNGAKDYPACELPKNTPYNNTMISCPTTVQTIFTSTTQNSVCWNQMNAPLSSQVPADQQCQYGQPEILNYGVRGGMNIGGSGCQFE